METSFSKMNITIYIAFTLLLTLWTISIICRRYRAYYPTTNIQLHPFAQPQFPTNENLPRGLDNAVIDTFPKYPYSGSSSQPSEECGVCVGGFLEKEMLRSLPKCGHVFHADCVDPWLRSNATCPICRDNLLTGHLPCEMASRAEFRVNIDHGRG